MPITIDLGGAPANEDCAQLGHTPDFAAVNRLEVDAYRAALIALFGTPPEGCTLTAQPNHHDFGTYTTLALVIGDDADLGPARAYAEAVEDGIGSWLEAGMAPPVTYDDAEAVCHKASIADVVLGALQTTRPDARGNFPLPAFAIIHRNLSAAYPDEAVRFAALMGDGFHRQAAWRIGDVLHCGLDRLHRGGGEMSERLFSLFLNACSHWRSYGSDWAALLESSRRVAKAAPRLSHAHSMHAVGAAMVSANSPAGPAQSQALRAEALAAARRSLELDPGNGEAYLAIGASYPQGGGWRAREENFLRALQLDPQLRSGGNLYMHVLRETGRADQALEQVTRALATDPFSHGMIGARALLHAAAGDIPAAHADLEQLDLVQPGEADELRWQIAFWWEPPERGLEATARYAPQSDPALSCFNLYLDRLRQARGAPLRGLPESCATAPPDWRVRMLARQGDVDGAYRELEQPLPARRRHTIFLFYPEMKAFRQDPRFMPLAQRLGLVDYWRQSGRWPDFCSEQDLPYDCRAAAESLKAASNEDAAR